MNLLFQSGVVELVNEGREIVVKRDEGTRQSEGPLHALTLNNFISTILFKRHVKGV